MKNHYYIGLATLLLFLLVGCSSAKEVDDSTREANTQNRANKENSSSDEKENNVVDGSDEESQESMKTQPFEFPARIEEKLPKNGTLKDVQLFKSDIEDMDWHQYDDYLKEDRTFNINEIKQPLIVDIDGRYDQDPQAYYIDQQLVQIAVDGATDMSDPGVSLYEIDLSSYKEGKYLLQLVKFEEENDGYKASVVGERHFSVSSGEK